MSDPIGLPQPDAWRARLASARSAATGLRSLLRQFAAMAREADLARGIAFYWKTEGSLQKIAGDADEPPSGVRADLQARSFEKAVALSLREKKVLRLPPGFAGEGLSLEDIPGRPWTAEDLPLFNATESTHAFLPLIVKESGQACLHAWYREGEGGGSVLELLKAILDEVARFVGGQSTEAQNRLIADYAVQLRLLESVAGEKDAKDFAVYVTNYARRLTGADRVTLFGARSPADVVFAGRMEGNFRGGRLRLLGASGLDEVSERSAEAVFLGEVAQGMVGAFLAKTRDGEDAGASGGVAKRSILVLAPRETEEDPAARPEPIRAYFENEPGDWLCALALRRSDGAINGYVLCEGKGALPAMDRAREIFSRLDRPLGRVWDRMLAWNCRRARWASRLLRLEAGAKADGSSRRKRIWLIPLLLGALFWLPVSFDVAGDATVSSGGFRTLSAPFPATLEEVAVRRGDVVAADTVLGRLQVEEEVLRRAELSSRLSSLEMRARLAQQKGQEQEAALSRIDAKVVRAELAMVESRLQRAVFQAPFDGVVVGPENFAQREGTLLQEGDPVFEVADLDAFVLTILLREHDFEALRRFAAANGAVEGTFRPSADPSREIPFVVEDLSSLPVFVEDRRPDRFRVGIRLPVEWGGAVAEQDPLSEWTGKVELSLGKRSLFRVTFRDFIHFLRLNLFL